MKNFLTSLFISSLIIFSACRGPEGPPGPPGPQGPRGADGGLVFAITDEIEFDYDPITFEFIYEFPSRYEVFESDAVLAFLLVDQFGDNIDVWEPLPIIYFVDQGTLLYSYDHSFVDIRFFMDGNFDLSTLSNDWTRGFIARIVIVPSEYAQAATEDGINFNDYNETIEYFDLDFGKN